MGSSGDAPKPEALGDMPQRASTSRSQRAGFSIFLDQVSDDTGHLHWETRLYHAESGSETSFPGVTPDDWIRWLVERIGMDQAGRIAPRTGRLPATIEVASVEILDVQTAARSDERSDLPSKITARVVVQLSGVGNIEHEIGSRILRGLAAAASSSDEIHQSD